jgi:F-type H+-transporting ATPase subunit epsilon
MNLKVLLPSRIFLNLERVSRIVAETREGSFGLLPHRLDCVAALVPGILEYTLGDQTAYLAVDQGVLVKSGADVMVSVRQAIQGTTLSELHETVKREYLSLDRQERDVRAAVARMESALLGRFAEFQHGR